MCSIIRALVDRLKALFLMHAIVEVEADLIAACAERKAELLRRAEQYEEDGSPVIAQELRRLAELLSADTPLASILRITAHLRADPAESAGAADTEAPAATAQAEPSSPAASVAPVQAMSPIVMEFDRAVGRHFRAVLGPLALARINCQVRFGPPHGGLAIVP